MPATKDAEEDKTADKPLTEESDQTISAADIKAAEDKVQRAFNLHTGGQTKRALNYFIQALKQNPYLIQDPFARSMASELTGLTPDQALEILIDPADQKKSLSAAQGSSLGPDSLSPTLEQDPKKGAYRT